MIALTADQFKDFLVSIEDLQKYDAVVRKEKGIEYPAVVLCFSSPTQAQLFLRRILQMSNANRYEASVYVDDYVPEIYGKLNKPDKPKEVA